MLIKCLYCGKSFESRGGKPALYCSADCKLNHYAEIERMNSKNEWERQTVAEFDHKFHLAETCRSLAETGESYAERQKRETLSKIPKINTEI